MRAQDLRGLDHKLFERGRGNACSVEVCSCRSIRIIDPNINCTYSSIVYTDGTRLRPKQMISGHRRTCPNSFLEKIWKT
jgi:hypothetical protein